MHGKVYRFLFIESLRRSQCIIFLFIFVLIAAEAIALAVLKNKIAQGQTRKALIVRIPEMEDVLYPGGGARIMISQRPVEPIKIGGKSYFLKGVRELDGKPTALINEAVYQVGDMIAQYRVTKITQDSVLFKHIKTGELQILRFGD